jgi:hypothetical protein
LQNRSSGSLPGSLSRAKRFIDTLHAAVSGHPAFDFA